MRSVSNTRPKTWIFLEKSLKTNAVIQLHGVCQAESMFHFNKNTAVTVKISLTWTPEPVRHLEDLEREVDGQQWAALGQQVFVDWKQAICSKKQECVE